MSFRAPAEWVVHELRAQRSGGRGSRRNLDGYWCERRCRIRVRVDPRSINLVRYDQSATIVLSAFDPHTTPRLDRYGAGYLSEGVIDPNTGESFYRSALEIPSTELSRLPGPLTVWYPACRIEHS